MKTISRLFGFAAIAFYLFAPSAIVFAATPPPTCQLSLNTTNINIGDSVTLKWTSTNATSGAITQVGNVGASGSVNLLPSSAAYTTYVGSFTGAGGTANCSATVYVSSGGGGGGGGNTTYGVQNATLGNSTYTPVTASSGGGGDSGSTNTSALVPCGTGTFGNKDNPNASDSTGCQACNLADLVQSLINFLIGVSIPIAAALFAYAGALYFTSGADTHNIDKAKGIFKNALIGFVIVISAWLVVNTLLHALLSQGKLFPNDSWFSISCSTTNRPVTGNIADILTKVLDTGASSYASGGTTGSCATAGDTTDGSGLCKQTNGTYELANGYKCPDGYTLDPNAGYCSDGNGGTAGQIKSTSGATTGSCPSAGDTTDGSGTCKSSNGLYEIANGFKCPDSTYYYSETGKCQSDDGKTITDPVVDASGGSSTNPNVTNGINTLDNNAGSSSTDKCAYYVRLALAAEGFTDFNTNHPGAAYQYDSYLTKDGFTAVAQSTQDGYAAQAGDVVVFQPVSGHSSGHIAMYDGSQWVSDFKQNNFYASNDYKTQNGSYTIYRH